MRNISIFSVALIFTSCIIFPAFSQTESITITTYYPAPFGVYQELRARRIAIGDTYHTAAFCWPGDVCVNQINADADLVVEGRVGIGTSNPTDMLNLVGGQDQVHVTLDEYNDNPNSPPDVFS
ncbi:MAG: hypothetical protein Q8O30_04690 [Candidatus Omnitrophota bacterium]|nr:hypothetical protein [Candidatus Omnitrophota bacterium]